MSFVFNSYILFRVFFVFKCCLCVNCIRRVGRIGRKEGIVDEMEYREKFFEWCLNRL